MNRGLSTLVALSSLILLPAVTFGHCQVPCGIYADQLRFEQLLEDEHTISKAQLQINELTATLSTPQSANQAARWVMTKEEHATHIQNTIASYFLCQRIKSDSPRYTEQLKAAHTVMTAAMKCKQSADPATAKALEMAIFDLYRAYEGKEPAFEHKH